MRLVIQTLLACLFNLSATHAASVARLGVLTRLHAGDGTPLVSSFARMAASANLAAYHINNRIGTLTADGVALLPDNFTVSLDLSDSWSSPTTGVKHAIRWVQEDIHVIIGAYRSAVAGPVAIVASTNDTPVLSWGSSAPALSDKGTYPTFSRVSSTDLVVTSHLIGVVSEMGWINIAVLYVDDSWGRCVPEDLHLPSPRLPPSSVPTRPHLLSLHRPPPASPTSSFLFPLPHLRAAELRQGQDQHPGGSLPFPGRRSFNLERNPGPGGVGVLSAGSEYTRRAMPGSDTLCTLARATVILSAVFDQDLPAIIREAISLGLLQRGYVWITTADVMTAQAVINAADTEVARCSLLRSRSEARAGAVDRGAERVDHRRAGPDGGRADREVGWLRRLVLRHVRTQEFWSVEGGCGWMSGRDSRCGPRRFDQVLRSTPLSELEQGSGLTADALGARTLCGSGAEGKGGVQLGDARGVECGGRLEEVGGCDERWRRGGGEVEKKKRRVGGQRRGECEVKTCGWELREVEERCRKGGGEVEERWRGASGELE
eukprot:696013-Rhodomonas_salina.1